MKKDIGTKLQYDLVNTDKCTIFPSRERSVCQKNPKTQSQGGVKEGNGESSPVTSGEK